jgi:hypothetical protein
MLRTVILVLTCATLLGGCAQTPEGAARTRAILGGLAEINSGPDPVVDQMNQRRAKTETECVSQKEYGGQVRTVCKEK